jgi:hypothetical protein
VLFPGSDPLAPMSSRFPLSPPDGRVDPSSAAPSGPDTRPFGMDFAVTPFRPTRMGEHSKKPTEFTETKQTAIYDDGKIKGYEPDTITYTVDDEE